MMINWIALTTVEQLDQLLQDASQQPLLIYKHSTTCAISHMAQSRLERQWEPGQVPGLKAYFVDLHKHRLVSNAVAERLGVRHQSPQVLLIKNGQCIYHESHSGIRFDALSDALSR